MDKRVEEILLKLNESQLKPVMDTEGQVLVIAGAGSGKTRVLTSRIAYLVLEKGISPFNILAITFTNKAAKEMKERLSSIVDNAGDLWCSTIHSMCVKILRTCIDKLGYTKDFTIYDDSDKEKVIKRICLDMGLEADKYVKQTKNYVSSAKNAFQTVDEYLKDFDNLPNVKIFREIMIKYDEALYKSNALDFDDLLVKTLQVFIDYPETADYYSRKFKYVHVDEFQDTNQVQFLIVKMLAKHHGNLFVVGDDDQSIYGWRGAVVDNILDFDKIFKRAKVYKLERNYRSTKKILDLANKVIKNNSSRRQKELWTENEDGGDIVYYDAIDERSEAGYVALQIKTLMGRYGYKYRDFAVLMRLNALSRGFEQEFIKYGIPYKVFGGFKFYERKEVKDVLGYLKLINNSRDNEAFLRIINCPKRGLGDKTINALLAYSAESNYSLFDTLARIEFVDTINSGAKTKLIAFRTLIYDLMQKATEMHFDDFIKYVVDQSNIKSMYVDNTEEDQNRIMNIDEFISSAIEFRKDNIEATLSDFVNMITLSSDTDDMDSVNSVVLATIHSVKGLEFKCVFISGLEEGIFPISRASDDCDLEEERRLMYVSITRAQKNLFLTKASSRFLHGERKFMGASRYLKECGVIKEKPKKQDIFSDFGEKRTDYMPFNDDDTPVTANVGYNSGYAKSQIQKNMRDIEKQKNIDYSQYKKGVKVKHVKFGIGTVLSVTGNGPSMIAEVVFKDYGVKKLAVKFTPMEIYNG